MKVLASTVSELRYTAEMYEEGIRLATAPRDQKIVRLEEQLRIARDALQADCGVVARKALEEIKKLDPE